jgi:serine/threonine protein kinase
MTADRWREVSRIYGAVLTKPESARPTVLASLCGDDAELRQEVESLLQSGQDAALIDRAASAHPSMVGLLAGHGIGSQIGAFRIESLLGVGGMGEVYRARDTKLNRDIAIKILPAAFASDQERLARFKREAQVLASLNHPNIGGIYGLEGQEGLDGREGPPCLVLELVEGPTLADRIARGPIPVDEALAIARQIADALECAHEQGIIHRDLKPANIKVREDGTVKVLDFGLAKMLEPTEAAAAPSGSLTQSPTITTPAMTAAGMILGTAAYMSPEQAKGRPADKRSDIWAFGCVLYEMLTTRRAFDGDDVSETLAAILRTEPDYSALPLGTPPALQTLVQRCLRKDRKRRLADISDARLDLDDVPIATDSDTRARRDVSGRERLAWVGLVTFVGLAVAFVSHGMRREELPLEVTHVEIATPATIDPVSIAVSPDARQLATVISDDDRSRLWLRSLETGESRILPKTDGAQFPFWSPDGRSLGFHADGSVKRFDLDGGSVRTLASSAVPSGASWNRDGVILFAPTALGVIWRTTASGGTPTAVTTMTLPAENGHSFPQFLPDGRHFLFYVIGRPEARGVWVGDIGGTQRRRLLDADAAAVYSPVGQLLYVRDQTLLAQPFDAATLQLSGRPMPVAPQVAVLGGVANTGAVAAAASTVVYRSGSAGRRRQFIWIDRTGRTVEKVGVPDLYFPANPSLSPDGRRVVVSRLFEGNADIWSLDLERGTFNRLTSEPAAETYPLWEPGGQRIAFSVSHVPNHPRIHVKSTVDGSEDQDLEIDGVANDWSGDGRFLLYRTTTVDGGFDLWAHSFGADRKAFPVASTRFNEREAQFSPDGRWIAFQSDESGSPQIYLQSFPQPHGKISVSASGGTQARWRSDGKELFYLTAEGRMMAVPVTLLSTGTASVGTAVSLFERRNLAGSGGAAFRQQYVVSQDGQRFLMNTLVDEPTATPISVVLNWTPQPSAK